MNTNFIIPAVDDESVELSPCLVTLQTKLDSFRGNIINSMRNGNVHVDVVHSRIAINYVVLKKNYCVSRSHS